MTDAVTKVDGVDRAEVDVAASTAHGHCSGRAVSIAAAVEAAGYE